MHVLLQIVRYFWKNLGCSSVLYETRICFPHELECQITLPEP